MSDMDLGPKGSVVSFELLRASQEKIREYDQLSYAASPKTFERALRVHNAAHLGICAVPENPDPQAFPVVPYACDEKPIRCAECHPAARATRCEETL